MESQSIPSQSPNYNQQVSKPEEAQILLSFPKAIEQVIYGKKITKISWEDKSFFISLHDKMLTLYKPEDNLHHPWTISEEDLIGEDWIVINEAS